MIINRHNYEEAFLLYVDNELSATDRAAVDDFVLKNEDLAKELAMLREATLIPEETVQFDFKQQLIKTETEISIDNCESFFLLDVDGELDANQKKEVERFVLQHPNVQAAYTLLHQTKLEPETIVFTNKEELYRKAGKRVVPMTWMKYAAAALVGGIAATLYLTVPQSKTIVTGSNTNIAAGVPAKPYYGTNPVKEAGPNNASAPVTVITKTATDKMVSAAIEKKEIVKQPKSVSKDNIVLLVAANKQPPKPVEVDNLLQKVHADRVAKNSTSNNDNHELAATITTSNAGKDNPVEFTEDEQTATLVTEAVYKEIDTRRDENENTLLFGSARINKNKLRGLLKKASGLFDKKANKNETEKTIQIASFEIKGK